MKVIIEFGDEEQESAINALNADQIHGLLYDIVYKKLRDTIKYNTDNYGYDVIDYADSLRDWIIEEAAVYGIILGGP